MGKRFMMMFMSAFVLFMSSMGIAEAAPAEEFKDIINNYYVEDVEPSIFDEKSEEEVIEHLDPYTDYMSLEEYQDFSQSINQELVGIGVVLEKSEEGIKIISVLPDSPAWKVGLQTGDIILEVEGVSLEDKSLEEAISIMRGQEGTTLTVTYYIPDLGKQKTETIIREPIQLPIVEYRVLGGNIGYIRLNSFSVNASEEMAAAIQALTGVDGWIVDFRNNGGGYVESAQEIAGFFPNVLNVFQLQTKNATSENFPAIGQNVNFDKRPFLLINSYSASASEMVSIAVKEQNGAILYGQQTYGKGTMQSFFEVDNHILKLTTAEFFSPDGTPINKIGVTPDIETDVGEELRTAHFDQLLLNHENYLNYPPLENATVDHKFQIKMNHEMDWDNVSLEDVSFIQLGGSEVEVELQSVDESTMKVIPKENLKKGEKYVLLLHPNWVTKNGITMSQGAYVEVSVN